MRNPPLPPLPTPEGPRSRQRITHRLWADWADVESDAPNADDAPTTVVVTRPIPRVDEFYAPTLGSIGDATSRFSGPLGALPDGLNARKRVKRTEWSLLVAAISIVVLLVAAVMVFGFFKLSPPSSSDTQGVGAATAAIPTPTATLAPTATATPLPAVESSFAGQDATTQGNWQTLYGSQGYMVVGDTQQLSPPVQVTPASQQEVVWQDSTSDPRALQKGTDSTDRIAACWYSESSFTIDVNVTDGQTYQLALYFVDWDQQNRAEIINVLDPTTDAVLDSRSVTTFANGEYLVWNVRGHIVIQVTNAPGSVNAVVSGVFVAPAAAPGSTPAIPAATPGDASTPTATAPESGVNATPIATPSDTPAAST